MTRVKLNILLVCVFVSVVGAYRPYCPCYAEPGYRCPPAPEGCELTKDECGCCDVCAGLQGESCGTGLPSCAGGLTCVLEECNPQVGDVTLPDGTVTQQLSEPPCLFLPYFQRGTCDEKGTAAKRQAIPFEGTSCEVDGVTIPDGEFVHVTPCKPCTCFNGQSICTHVDCPWGWLQSNCAQWEYPSDQCCPVCVQQDLEISPHLPLPVASKRQALPVTGASCEVSGVTIQEGEFVDVTPCQHCGCFNGQPICAVVDCFWSPSCTQWAYPADRCCPVCVQEAGPVMVDLPVASKRETLARTCVVDGVTIEEGEFVVTDDYGCTECGCTGGQPLCWSMACAMDINCAEWERVPGQCCPVCTAYHDHHIINIPMVSKRSSSLPRTCEVQGVTIAEGEFKPIDQNGCTTCGCNNGQSFCMAIGCALPANCLQTEQIPGQCCPVCTSTGCEVDGVIIQEGETADITPCKHCTCSNGQPVCAHVDCFWHGACAQWEYHDDRCCPVCVQEASPVMIDLPVASKRDTQDTCTINGVTLPQGQLYPMDAYHCIQCACVNGEPSCVDYSGSCAPMFNCLSHFQIPGQCCPICMFYMRAPELTPAIEEKNKRTSPVRPTTCEVDGVTIAEGEWKPIDQNGCTTCGCNNGQSFCQAIGCALPANCAETQQIPGQCCPVCIRYATCEVNGVTIQEGESKPTDEYGCETCTCVNGQPICQVIACALPANCAETERVPGQCCPVCTSFTTCEVNGVTIQEGEWVPTDEYGCETCTCDNGMTLCQAIACAPLFNCAETERVPGQCCPVCKTPLQDLPLLLSKRQALPQVDCNLVDIDCGWNPTCVQWEDIPGQCCPVCKEDCALVDCWWSPTCAEWEDVPGQCCPICKQHMDQSDP
ncbi:KCP [Branchiostoma lanceolatum]|uniref:KCP protein n=1 Tax=Branchiostoma lanceolatum TaxID=7740 RepID=A0A8J9WFL5_BRALA|nr:KCP [Branchiostoma lanceolatum]